MTYPRAFLLPFLLPAFLTPALTQADVVSAEATNHQVRIIDSDNSDKTWSVTSVQKNSGLGFWEGGPGGTGRMVITRGGRVGIGTTSPDHELVIRGNDPVVDIHDDTQANSENAARLRLLERAAPGREGGGYLHWNGSTNQFRFGTYLEGSPTATLVIDRTNNNVGIGTSNLGAGDFRLMVNGPIRAKEIVVETGWSDFVFDDGYQLAPLAEVSAYITAHGHLPGIPTAQDVARDGIAVGDIQSRLLMKIEELTLHVIALETRLAAVEGGTDQ